MLSIGKFIPAFYWRSRYKQPRLLIGQSMRCVNWPLANQRTATVNIEYLGLCPIYSSVKSVELLFEPLSVERWL